LGIASSKVMMCSVGVAVGVGVGVAVAVGVGVLVGVRLAVGVDVGVWVGVAPGRSQNLLPVRVFPSSGMPYSIQLLALTVPSTVVSPTEK
jgi:hypothetical protein